MLAEDCRLSCPVLESTTLVSQYGKVFNRDDRDCPVSKTGMIFHFRRAEMERLMDLGAIAVPHGPSSILLFL